MVYKWKLIINLFLDIKNLSKLLFFKNLICEWCPEVGSNHRHKDFQLFLISSKMINLKYFARGFVLIDKGSL
jgi:hypothetical protein